MTSPTPFFSLLSFGIVTVYSSQSADPVVVTDIPSFFWSSVPADPAKLAGVIK